MKLAKTVAVLAAVCTMLAGCGFEDIEANTSIIVTTTTAQEGPLMTPDSSLDGESSAGVVSDTTADNSEADKPEDIIFKATANVNARSGPSTDFDIVKVVSEGDEVVVTGKEDNWYKVKIDELDAYIIEDYLDGDDSLLEVAADEGAVDLPTE